MINKTLDANFLTTLVGAGLGASALEGNGDIAGTAIGLGVGAFVGSQLKLDLPKFDKYIQRNQRLVINNKPVPEIEKLREKLNLQLNENAKGFDFLPDTDTPFDKKNPFQTLTNSNINSVINESTNLAELKTINTILKSENNLEKIDPEILVGDFRPLDDITRLTQNSPIDNQVSVLKRYFSEIGYSGEDLDKKITLFSGLMSEDKSLVINRNTNTVSFGSTDFKVSSNFAKEGGISSYVDNDNYYAVRKTNPFASMYLESGENKLSGRAIAQALGINFADAAKEDALAKQIEEFARRGAKPEDIKALLMQSPEFTEGQVNNFIKKSYQHLERESGLRAMGASQGDIENQATDLAKNISKQTSVHKVFNLDEKGIIRDKQSFRSFSANSRNGEGSELQRFREKLAKDLNMENIQEAVKSGHNHIVNTYGSEAGLNAMAMGERSPLTTGSRENNINISKNANNKVVQAFNILREKGAIPREYSTSSAVSRITVNPDHFNLAAKYLFPTMTASLSDGASIGKASIAKEYYHSSYKKYDIFSSNTGDMSLSKELKDHITAKTNLGMSFDAPEIESRRYSNLIGKLERLKVKENNITDSIDKNPKNKRLIRDLSINKQRQKNLGLSLGFNENKAKLEIQKHLSTLDPNSGDAKALSGILTAMSLGTKEGSDSLEAYRSVANKRFKKNALLGISPNGAEIRLSTEFNNHKLSKASRSIDANSDSKATFVFQGTKDTGTDKIRKDFGVSSKVVVENVKENEFDLKYGLSETLNKTGYVPIETTSGLQFDTNLKDSNNKPILKTMDEIRPMILEEASKAKASGVGMITGFKDAGQDLSTEIYNTLKKGGTLSEISALPEAMQQRLQTIVDGVNTNVSSLGLSSEDAAKATRGRYWAVSQLATSLTENKAASESVVGLGILGVKNLNNLVDTIELDPNLSGKESNYALNILTDMFGKKVLEDSTGDIDSLRTTLNNSYIEKVQEVQEMFSQNNLGKNVALGDIYGEDVLKTFNLAYLKEGESTHIGSSDISTIMRLGSGSREKTLSHSAQLHLKMTGGATTENLSIYGDQSPEKLYDLKFSSELSTSVDKDITLNSYLEGKSENAKKKFISKLALTEPESIDKFLIAEGVPEQIRNQDFLYYSMENNNTKKIKTVPIHKYSTAQVGTTILENGNTVFKGLKKEVMDLIVADQTFSRLGDSYKETFEDASNAVAKRVEDIFLNSNNVQLKGAIALEAPNSTYALARQTANLDFDRVVGEYAEKGMSVIGGSREFAVDFLKGQGIDVDLSNLDKFIDKKSGLLLTELTDGSLKKSIFLENREPAQSANSVRSAYMYVLGDQYSGEDSKSFVYHSTLDKHYVELMYGDQDGDNTTTYGAQRKLTREEYASQLVRKRRAATNRNSLIQLNEALKIKGKTDTKQPLFSVYDLIQETNSNLDQLGFKQDSPEYFEHLASRQKERMYKGTVKGGVVKTASPGVTQLATAMAESAFQMDSYKGVPLTLLDREMMSSLGHGLVENLLKTKHLDTNTFSNKELPVESLIQARDNLTKNNSIDNFNNYEAAFYKQFDDLIPENIRPQYQGYVEKLFQADITHMTNARTNPSNTMHVAKNTTRIREGGVDEMGEVIQDIASSRNTTGISQLATEATEINIERSLQVSYNDLLSNAKQNLIKNKFPLMVGAGGLALGALITQKDPDFKPSKKAVADTGSMMLAPNVVSQEQSKQSDPMILKSLGKTVTDFVGPETSLQDISHSVKQTVKIQGSYNNFEREMSDNMKEAIFGNTISNVRIEREYD